MYRFEKYTIKMPSQHTAVGASSLEQNECIVTDEEWYNLDDHDFGDAHSGWVLYVECVCMCVHVYLMKNQNAPRPSGHLPVLLSPHSNLCACTPGLVF